MVIVVESIVESYNVSACDDSYIVSPLYYRITGRKSAWYYKTEDAYLVVIQHPHKNDTLLVFPELGQGNYDLTACVLQKLYQLGQNVQLARYTDENIRSLQKAFNHIQNNIVESVVIIDEDSMDWRYPVHILNTQTVSEMQGSAFNRIRAKYKKAAKTISYEYCNKSYGLREMRAALKFWEGNMIIANKDTEDMSEFYHEFFDIIDTYNGRWSGMMFYEGKRPVGFSVWEEISDIHANSFITLGDTSIAGLADFQLVSMCQWLHGRGIQNLNVGGSETESLDAYKRKFMPEFSIDLKSAMVRYKNFDIPPHVEYAKFV